MILKGDNEQTPIKKHKDPYSSKFNGVTSDMNASKTDADDSHASKKTKSTGDLEALESKKHKKPKSVSDLKKTKKGKGKKKTAKKSKKDEAPEVDQPAEADNDEIIVDSAWSSFTPAAKKKQSQIKKVKNRILAD